MAVDPWIHFDDLFTRGDNSFVAELRRMHDPERLGKFASRWIADTRPFARQAMLDYLAMPLNCYRHEPLVKRLFKLAEAAKDDELMGAFLVAFDRSIRRRRKILVQTHSQQFPTRAAAETAIRQWEKDGFQNASIYAGPKSKSFGAYAFRAREADQAARNKMPVPRGSMKKAIHHNNYLVGRLERNRILFSLPTRRYLRRRAWRYFRLLANLDSTRYLKAATNFLMQYRDDDIDSPTHLLDNWGLVHAFFHNCPAVTRPAKGCDFVPGKGLSDLTFAPYLAESWKLSPDLLLKMLVEAKCRTVRLFAVRQLGPTLCDTLAKQSVATLLKIADHEDPEVSAFGMALLESTPYFEQVSINEWLDRLNGTEPERVARYADLLTRRIDRTLVSLEDLMRLSSHRFQPVAEFGFQLLGEKSFARANVPALLTLTQAECENLRPKLCDWLWAQLNQFAPVEADWVLEFLDCKHADVRQFGWSRFVELPIHKDITIWQQLIETPYADVRELLAGMLAEVAKVTDTATLAFMWATALSAIHRGGRQKPGIVHQIVARIAQDPADAESLLPLLALAVRSLRGPEFRAGLSGLMTLCENKPELAPLIRRQFPELTF